MFSMAALAAMTSIELKMITAVSEAFWGAALVGSFLDMDAVDGISSQAMQQGGLGLLLTTLIITAPPMAAMFFQGTLGGFVPYAQIGSSPAARPGPAGQPPGSYAIGDYSGGAGNAPQQLGQNTTGPGVGATPSRIAGAPATPSASEGQGTFGAANKPDRG
jgi:type IV secretion system protein VirB6